MLMGTTLLQTLGSRFDSIELSRTSVTLAIARGAVAIALCGTGFSPPVTNVGLFLALLAFVALPDVVARMRVVLQQPVARAALVLFGVLALAMLWADAPWALRLHTLNGWRPVLLMLLVLALFSTWESKARLAAAYVGFGVFGALVSFYSWHFKVTLLESGPLGTALRNPSTQSMVFVAAFTLALALAMVKPKTRWLWASAAAALFLNLLFVTTGRSGQMAVALVAITLTLTLVQGRTRLGLLAALPVVAAVVVALSPVVQQRFGLGWREMQSVQESPENNSMGMRVVMWRNTVQVIRASPWVGHGTGGFDAAYAMRIESNDGSWRSLPTSDPHNQYLYVWACAGLLGLAAFVGFLVAAARQPAARPWKQTALALLLAWSATSLFSSHFQTFSEGHLLLLLLGVLLAPQTGVAPAQAGAQLTRAAN